MEGSSMYFVEKDEEIMVVYGLMNSVCLCSRKEKAFAVSNPARARLIPSIPPFCTFSEYL
jgi:hypothetical protein